MKKSYNEPKLGVFVMSHDDVITTSQPGVTVDDDMNGTNHSVYGPTYWESNN